MRWFMALGLFVLVILALGACAPVPVAVEARAPGVSGVMAEKPQVLRANGFGTVVPAAELTAGQEKLLAMRASRIDAYRNLAEMLNGMSVVGNTTVRQMATDHDHVRSLVSDVVRGARVVNIEQVDDETYQTIVELTLSRRFYLCLQDPMGAECGVSVGPRTGGAPVAVVQSAATAAAGTCPGSMCVHAPYLYHPGQPLP